MNYKELTERLGRDDLSMIEEVQQYIVDNYKLKGSARTSAEGIMNSSFGDMQELENAYNKNGAEGGATYIVDNLPDAARKKYLKESASINEGQFSWLTQDSGTQIGSERGNTIDVWMFDDKGNSWFEDRYEGYGEFGGMDYYELLAVMNGYTEEDVKVLGKRDFREVGIDLAFGKLDPADMSQSDVLFPALVSNKRFNWKRHDFTKEPESDPNQSWMRESYVSDYASLMNHITPLKEGQQILKHIKVYEQFVNESNDFYKSYSEAIDAVQAYAQSKGYDLDQEEYGFAYTDASDKPKNGETKEEHITLYKNGREQKKALHVSMYGRNSGFEITMYIN